MGAMKQLAMEREEQQREDALITAAELREDLAQTTLALARMTRERDRLASDLRAEQAHSEYLTDQLKRATRPVADNAPNQE